MLQNKLRSQIKQQRQTLSPQQQKTAEDALTALLLQQPIIAKSQHIALYLPHNGEISPLSFAKKAWTKGKKLYLPVINPSNSQPTVMLFKEWNTKSTLVKNHFGIDEPETTQNISPNQLDLVLMPLVAFDKEGNRLGMGGGFYDKTFAFKKNKSQSKPLLLGLAHAFQEVDALATNSWDVAMDGVATDTKVFWI